MCKVSRSLHNLLAKKTTTQGSCAIAKMNIFDKNTQICKPKRALLKGRIGNMKRIEKKLARCLLRKKKVTTMAMAMAMDICSCSPPSLSRYHEKGATFSFPIESTTIDNVHVRVRWTCICLSVSLSLIFTLRRPLPLLPYLSCPASARCKEREDWIVSKHIASNEAKCSLPLSTRRRRQSSSSSSTFSVLRQTAIDNNHNRPLLIVFWLPYLVFFSSFVSYFPLFRYTFSSLAPLLFNLLPLHCAILCSSSPACLFVLLSLTKQTKSILSFHSRLFFSSSFVLERI